MTSFLSELRIYLGRVAQFDARDWALCLAWVGLLCGLCFSTLGFLLYGVSARGARFPAEAWLVPGGAALFTVAAAVDAIGHRTIYKAEIQRAEGLVHAVTIFCGIASCVLLCAAYKGGRA